MKINKFILPVISICTALSCASCKKNFVVNENLKSGDVLTKTYTQYTLGSSKPTDDGTVIQDVKYNFDVIVTLGDPKSGSKYPTISSVKYTDKAVLWKPVGYIDSKSTESSFTTENIAQLKLDIPLILKAFENYGIDELVNFVTTSSAGTRQRALYFTSTDFASGSIVNFPEFQATTVLGETSLTPARSKLASNVIVGTYIAVLTAICK